jgi:hypothetical protein
LQLLDEQLGVGGGGGGAQFEHGADGEVVLVVDAKEIGKRLMRKKPPIRAVTANPVRA